MMMMMLMMMMMMTVEVEVVDAAVAATTMMVKAEAAAIAIEVGLYAVKEASTSAAYIAQQQRQQQQNHYKQQLTLPYISTEKIALPETLNTYINATLHTYIDVSKQYQVVQWLSALLDLNTHTQTGLAYSSVNTVVGNQVATVYSPVFLLL